MYMSEQKKQQPYTTIFGMSQVEMPKGFFDLRDPDEALAMFMGDKTLMARGGAAASRSR